MLNPHHEMHMQTCCSLPLPTPTHIWTLMSANLDTIVSASKGRALEYSQWKLLAALVTVDKLLLALWLFQLRHSLQKVQGAQC